DVESVTVAVAFVLADLDAVGQVEFNSDADGSHTTSRRFLPTARCSGVSLCSRPQRGTQSRVSPAFHTQKRKNHLAFVHQGLKDYEAALAVLAEALALDKTGEYRERLLQKLSEVLGLLQRRHHHEYLPLLN